MASSSVEIAQRRDVGMAIERAVVEADLGVEADQRAGLGDDERIDLQQAHVLGEKRLIELRQHALRLLGHLAAKAERVRDRVRMMRHEAGRRIDRE